MYKYFAIEEKLWHTQKSVKEETCKYLVKIISSKRGNEYKLQEIQDLFQINDQLTLMTRVGLRAQRGKTGGLEFSGAEVSDAWDMNVYSERSGEVPAGAGVVSVPGMWVCRFLRFLQEDPTLPNWSLWWGLALVLWLQGTPTQGRAWGPQPRPDSN